VATSCWFESGQGHQFRLSRFGAAQRAARAQRSARACARRCKQEHCPTFIAGGCRLPTCLRSMTSTSFGRGRPSAADPRAFPALASYECRTRRSRISANPPDDFGHASLGRFDGRGYCAANIAGSAHHVPRLRRRSTVLLELIVAAFIAAYVLLVAFGHVLVVIAIYRCLRERRRS
jgi:hypothetical protein